MKKKKNKGGGRDVLTCCGEARKVSKREVERFPLVRRGEPSLGEGEKKKRTIAEQKKGKVH